MNPNIQHILELYKNFSDGDKNRLIYELDNLGLREVYDINQKKFRVEYINFYGKHLVDRTFKAISRRKLERELVYFEKNNGHRCYNKYWDESRISDEERTKFRNNTYIQIIITEL